MTYRPRPRVVEVTKHWSVDIVTNSLSRSRGSIILVSYCSHALVHCSLRIEVLLLVLLVK